MKPGPRLLGASSNNLGFSDYYTMPVKCRCQKFFLDFCVTDNMEVNILGVPQMQTLNLNYDVVAREIFTIDNSSNLVLMMGPLTVPPHHSRDRRQACESAQPAAP